MTICSCGFDNSGDGRLPERCLGCGVPLRPPDDHKRPVPGFSVSQYDETPVIVIEEMRESDDLLAGIYAIHRSDIRWGRGIGAETYGYYQKGFSATVAVSEFAEGDEVECPECGDDRAMYKSGFDGCVASFANLRCPTCDHEYFAHFDC